MGTLKVKEKMSCLAKIQIDRVPTICMHRRSVSRIYPSHKVCRRARRARRARFYCRSQPAKEDQCVCALEEWQAGIGAIFIHSRTSSGGAGCAWLVPLARAGTRLKAASNSVAGSQTVEAWACDLGYTAHNWQAVPGWTREHTLAAKLYTIGRGVLLTLCT